MCQAEIECRQKKGSGRGKVRQDQSTCRTRGKNEEQASKASCRYGTLCRQAKIAGRWKLQLGTRCKQVLRNAGTVACRYKLRTGTTRCGKEQIQVERGAGRRRQVQLGNKEQTSTRSRK